MSELFSSSKAKSVSFNNPSRSLDFSTFNRSHRVLTVSSAEVGLVWAGVRHHLEPWLVDDIKEVLGIDGESMSCGQHLFLVVLLETEAKQMIQRFILHKITFLLAEWIWKSGVKSWWKVERMMSWCHQTHLVITYCWANFIFPISSAKSEFRSFCAISIWWSKQEQHTKHHFSTTVNRSCVDNHWVCVITSLCVLAGSCGNVSSTVANKVRSARPTSYNKKHT